MRYENMVDGVFLSRPNRFIAHVLIQGREEICHVKNTGRCRELLQAGVRVWCQNFDSDHRKTAYDLIAVEKGQRLINMDSQAPNLAAGEWLRSGGLGELTDLRAEVTHGDSRFDFAFMKDGRQCFLEVKGVTLEHDGHCAFPDAPTLRGVKHIQGLTRLAGEGYGAYILFVIQMEDAVSLRPNDGTDPAFGVALRQAKAAGVELIAMDCLVTPGEMVLHRPVEIRLD